MRIFRTPHSLLNTSRSRAGFTLVELIVSLGIFTSVMLVAVGVLASIGDASREAGAQRAVIDNLNLAIESMARSMRVGSEYYCDDANTPPASGADGVNDCPEGGEAIAYTNIDGDRFGYWLSGTRVIRGQYRQGAWQSGDQIALTSPEIEIDTLRFVVQGSAIGDADELQPTVFMLVSGTADVGEATEEFSIQTTITQREFQAGG